jgi:hypothetical protein
VASKPLRREELEGVFDLEVGNEVVARVVEH